MRNRGYVYTGFLPPGTDPDHLLDYLATTYTHSSRAVWEARIGSGQVTLEGNRLTWRRPPWDEPDAPRTFAVLHRDDDLLAVAKPAGLPTLPGGNYLENTLLSVVRESDRCASPVHRLGRWTSGLVLFTRNREAMRSVSECWRRNDVRKVYRALASGRPEEDRFDIGVPIGPVPHPLLGTVHAVSPEGKPARSIVTVLERRERCFLCEVEIETGRPHQIRIHLAAAGHPLCGDPLYLPGGLPAARAVPGDPGYRLHAMALELDHPAGTGRLSLFCRPPADLERGRGTVPCGDGPQPS